MAMCLFIILYNLKHKVYDFILNLLEVYLSKNQ